MGLVRIFLLGKPFEKSFGFCAWYPIDTNSTTTYILLIISQVYASYYAGVMFVGADLKLVSIMIQFKMHLDFISKSIRNYVPQKTEADMNFIKEIVRYHSHILE